MIFQVCFVKLSYAFLYKKFFHTSYFYVNIYWQCVLQPRQINSEASYVFKNSLVSNTSGKNLDGIRRLQYIFYDLQNIG